MVVFKSIDMELYMELQQYEHLRFLDMFKIDKIDKITHETTRLSGKGRLATISVTVGYGYMSIYRPKVGGYYVRSERGRDGYLEVLSEDIV